VILQTMHGHKVFPNLRQRNNIQEQLPLDIGPKFATNWINKQWGGWGDSLLDRGVPSSAWLRSRRSAEVRRSRGRSSDESSVDAFSCSTVALLTLFARWSATLRTEAAKAAAVGMAQAILLAGLPGHFVWPVSMQSDRVTPQHCLPPPPSADHVQCRVSDGQLDVGPLLERAPGARRLSMPATLPLAEAMSRFYKAPGQLARHLLWQLVLWVSFLLERGAWIQGASTDHLAAPLPMGNTRRRNIPFRVRDAVGEAAGGGQLGRSGRAVMAAMHRFTRHCSKKLSKSGRKANQYLLQRVKGYWHHLRAVFRAPECRIYSLALDATRAAGKDMLFQTLYVPEVGVGAWLPPQAGGGAAGGKKTVGRKRKKTVGRKRKKTVGRKRKKTQLLTTVSHSGPPRRRKR